MGANALSHLIPNPNLNPKPNPVRKCISTGYAKTVPQQGGADKNCNSPMHNYVFHITLSLPQLHFCYFYSVLLLFLGPVV